MRRLGAQAFEISGTTRTWPGERVSVPGNAPDKELQADAYKQAYLDGFEEGYNDGDNEARKVLEKAQEDAQAALQRAEAERQHWRDQLVLLTQQFAETQASQFKQMEALAITVAYAAVCRILGKAHAEGSLVPAVCKEVLANQRNRNTVLRLAPADAASLQGLELTVQVMPDPALRSGECILDTGLGEIEVGIEAQMQGLLRALLAAFSGSP